MTSKSPTSSIIAIEEHFMHTSLSDHFGKAAHGPARIMDRLFDYSETRIKEMDAAGIDLQVLSHQSPGSQRLPAEIAVSACRASNDALAGIIANHPDRFAGFAMIPTEQPDEAADELSRAVGDLGFKGVMIHGLSDGNFVDLEQYWPIFARAEALGVPVYIHPALPDRTVIGRYYAPYTESHPMLTRAAWGFGVEAGTQAVRLILSGLFERHPDVKILLGHLGEAIPFWLDRVEASLSRPGNAPSNFAETFRKNFWLTTSGFFSDRALTCTIDAVGVERVLFAVDWPYADNKEAVDWLSAAPLDDADRAAIFSRNAKALLGL